MPPILLGIAQYNELPVKYNVAKFVRLINSFGIHPVSVLYTKLRAVSLRKFEIDTGMPLQMEL